MIQFCIFLHFFHKKVYKTRKRWYNYSIKSNKGTNMIRVILGFLMVFGSVGGMENGTDDQLLAQLAMAVVGLTLMYFGVKKVAKPVYYG